MTHIARFIHSAEGVRYSCSCGRTGREVYPDDKQGSGKDHARKAFEAHAGFDPANRIDVTPAHLFPDDDERPVKVRIAE